MSHRHNFGSETITTDAKEARPPRLGRLVGALAASLLALGTLGTTLVVAQAPANASAPIPTAQGGATEVVSNSGAIDDTCGSGLPPLTPFTSIQAAVNAATPGTVIYVCAGTYNENVTVNKLVYILGAEWSVAAGAGNSSVRTDPTGESIVDGSFTYASGATSGALQGLTLNGNGSSPAVTAEDVGSGWNFSNDIVDVSNGGFLFNTDGAANPATSTISGNRFTQATPSSAGSGWSGSGVAFYGATNSTGNNVTISNNDFQDSTGPAGSISANAFGSSAGCTSTTTVPSGASQVYFSNNLNVTGNTFEFAGSTGSNYESNSIVAMCTTNASITNNTVTDTAANDALASSAFYFGGGDWNSTISGNTLVGDGASDASGININSDFYPAGTGIAVTSNHVSGYLYGIHVKGSLSAFSVTSNTVSGSGDSGIQVEAGDNSGSLVGNAVSGSVGPDCVDKSTGSGTAGTANAWSENSGASSLPAGLCGTLATIPPARSGTSEVVSSTGIIDSSCGSGLPAVTPFTTLQAAVNAASPGMIIYVCAGSYGGNVSINKVVYIFGAEWNVPAGAGNSTVRTDPTGESTINGSLAYAAGATSGAIQGLTISGNGSSPAVTAEDVGSNWTWENNIVDVSNGGFLFNTDGAANPATSTISGNRFTQATPSSAGSGWSGSGVAFYGATNSTGNNVTISNNDFQDSTGPAGSISANAFGSSAGCTSTTTVPSGASQVYFSNNLNVTGNTFEFAGSTGSNYESNSIVAMCTTNASITNNTVTDTAANDALASSAFYFGGGDWNSTISGNTLVGDGASDASGININSDFYPAGTGIAVTSNHVSGYLYGIHVKGSLSAFSVTSNTVSGSGDSGIRVESGDNHGVLAGNTVSGTASGIDCTDVSNDSETLGTANIWTANSGSASSPTGICGPLPTIPAAHGGESAVVSNSGTIDASCGSGVTTTTVFTSLQAAVNAANPGSIIYVCAGTYLGNVSINKLVYILGAQWSVSAGAGQAAVRTNSGAESIIGGSVTYTAGATSGALQGLTLNGNGSSPAVTAEDVGSGWNFSNDIVDVSNGGFLFNTDGAANPATSTISGNRFTQATPSSAGSGWSGSGVAFYGATNSTGNNVTISNNDFQDSTGPAGSISANAFGSSAGCTSTTTVPSGASQVYFSNNLNVTGNTFEFAGSTGSNYESNSIVAMCTTNASITNNTVTDTAANDALASSAFYFGGGDWNSTISGNTLVGDGASDASGININSDFYPAGTGIAVTSNHVSGYLYGIHVKGSLSAFSVHSNTVTASGATGLQVESGDTGGSLAGNTVSGSVGPDCVDKSTGSGTSGTANTWSVNSGASSSPAGLCGPLPTIPASRSGAGEIVSVTGTIDASCGSGLPPFTPFTSIQAAVNAASPGTIIYVCAGTYNENVSINKLVYIFGAQWSVAAGAGNSSARTNKVGEATINGSVTYSAGATSGVLQGFTIKGNGSNPAVLAEDVGSGWTWENNIVDMSFAGFLFNTDGVANPATSTISGNRFTQATPSSATQGWSGTGVGFYGATNSTGNNVTISNNDFQDSTGPEGVISANAFGSSAGCTSTTTVPSGASQVYFSNNLNVTGNTIEFAGSTGSNYESNAIVAMCTTNASITNNTVTDSATGDALAQSAFYFGGGDWNSTISGNTLSGGGATNASGININSDFYPGGTGIAVTSNHVSGYLYGIHVKGSLSAFSVTSNTVSGSGAAGVQVESTDSRGTVTGNTISGTASGVGNADCVDKSSGSGTSGTANTWNTNAASTSSPVGLCGVAVTAVTPTGGPTAGGNTVTVTGVGLTGATVVKFGNSLGTGIHVVSGTSLTVVAPPGTGGTIVDVVVTATLGTSATSTADHYGYFVPPTETKDAPFTGPPAGGTAVTITGTGFAGATAVMFGSTPATSFTVSSSTSILAYSPPEAAGMVNTTVITPGGTTPIVLADEFTYIAPVPVISSISPNVGVAGTSVVITGSGFTGATSVKFGTAASSSVTYTSNTSITAVAPAGSPSSAVNITVTSPGGTSATNSSDVFTYGPIVTSVSPNAGSHLGGTLVTIKGAGFTGATAVHFGTTAATSAITVNAAGTQITVNAPAHVAGAVDITVTVPGGTSPTSSTDVFTYV